MVGNGNGVLAVIGGTGAFFGVRGYFKAPCDPVLGERFTSACEDPAMRRIYAAGAGKRHGVLYLVPLSPPQITATPSGPAIVHANDFSLATASKPPAAGQALSLFPPSLAPLPA